VPSLLAVFFSKLLHDVIGVFHLGAAPDEQQRQKRTQFVRRPRRNVKWVVYAKPPFAGPQLRRPLRAQGRHFQPSDRRYRRRPGAQCFGALSLVVALLQQRMQDGLQCLFIFGQVGQEALVGGHICLDVTAETWLLTR
jgi:hypothetical protein